MPPLGPHGQPFDALVRKGLVTATMLDAALAEQGVTGERLGAILIRNGFLTQDQYIRFLAECDPRSLHEEVVRQSRVPPDILERHGIILAAETEDTLFAASMSEEPFVAEILRDYYPNKRIFFVPFAPDALEPFLDSVRRQAAQQDMAGATNAQVIDRLLQRALSEGASDIHILPRAKSFTMLFRLLGVRRIVYEGGLEQYATVIAQIKDRARMDLAEHRVPQDGSFQLSFQDRLVDIRVATLPGVEGEICVLRLLDPQRTRLVLDHLGISRLPLWRQGFQQQHGLCLICGPTGSGKTTTLNASVREMDRFGKAIYSVEDPVEYRIPYTGQVNVNPGADLDFARTIRAFLRADPDVIVLGEVRDPETARNAVRAADTGHMVLATLHTGSIQGSMNRLNDLGVPPFEIKSLLRAVLVQSLVRTTCKACQGAGCVACKDIGFDGRTLVSECTAFEHPEEVMAAMEGHRDWPTMVEDAVGKYRAGITTADELRRVFGSSVEKLLRQPVSVAS